MKKSIFILATAALVLASCNNDVKIAENKTLGNEPQEIGFFPLSQSPKRVHGDAMYNAVSGVKYPENYDMKVVAYSIPETGTPGNYFGSATANESPLFTYQYAAGTSNPSANANYWGGRPPQYWPLAPATLNFLAVSNNGSPDADMVSETFEADYASGVNVTLGNNIPQNAHSAATVGQHDLMYAFGTASVTQSGNALTFPDYVEMEFKHALAWVIFRVKAGNAAAEAISIKNIKLVDAYYGGAFQARVDNYNLTTPALAWNTSDTKWNSANNKSDQYSPNFSADYNVDGTHSGIANNSKSLINGTFFNVGDGLLVVPTSELASPEVSMSKILIEYYLNDNLYTYEYTPAERTYQKGKKYIYDITMTLHEIFVEPSVVDWDATGNVGEFVDIPSYKIGEDVNYGEISKAESTYKFKITGLTCTTPAVAKADGSEDFTTLGMSSYSAGVATITFGVGKNDTGANKSYSIKVTDNNNTPEDTTDDKVSVITITQAH